MKLEGVFTALITPFAPDGGVDEPALRALVEGQLAAGIHGLVACGTTGEPPTLSAEEYDRVVRTVVEVAGGRIPVLAGTGTNCTKKTIAATRHARDLGCDGALVVTPYYNKPQQDGMFEHFRAVAAEGGLPVVLYNVPGRTGVNLLPRTVARLASVPGILGVKEASGSVGAVREIVSAVGPGFAVLSGDDGLALASWALGACGVVSVASNLVPAAMVALWDAWKAGRTDEAAALDRRLAPLCAALFLESSPAPCKAAGAMLGVCSDAVRLPLVPATPATREALRAALVQAGALPA
jgi:4-hydroxy-tetrahydrodipicolinate synthase